MYTISLALLASTLGSAWASPAAAEHTLDRVRASGMRCYDIGDYACFASEMERALAISHEDLDRYNLACGYALTGRTEDALALLRDLVARGTEYDFTSDSDFASLRRLPAYTELVAATVYYEEVNERLEPLRDRALMHYYEGRYEVFVKIMEPVAGASNNDVDLYNLACGYALTHRTGQAIALLESLADRGIDHGAAIDRDFDNLRDHPRFQALLARIAER